MRLFVAIDLKEGVRAEIGRLVDRLAARFDAARPGASRQVKWVSVENLHVTLRFIGHVDEAQAKTIRSVLAAPLETGAFQLAFAGLGAFPPAGPPRIIWLGVSEGAREMGAANAEIEARVQAAGLPRDERPFRAHLTLGRYRTSGRSAERRLLSELGRVEAGPCLVDHTTLYESQLSSKGPKYRAMARTDLRI